MYRDKDCAEFFAAQGTIGEKIFDLIAEGQTDIRGNFSERWHANVRQGWLRCGSERKHLRMCRSSDRPSAHAVVIEEVAGYGVKEEFKQPSGLTLIRLGRDTLWNAQLDLANRLLKEFVFGLAPQKPKAPAGLIH